MPVGLSTYLNNAWLNTVRGGGTSFTAVASVWAQLHTATGTPGVNGTANVSSTTARRQVTFSVSSGVLTNTTSPQWLNWAGTNGENLRYVSFWDASTAGNFLWYADFGTTYTISTFDTFTISTITITAVNAS